MIAADGSQLGIMEVDVALAQAMEQGLDLVEVAAAARPPVVRIMDFGKFKFEQAKQARLAKKKQHVIHLKEVKYRPGIDDHDFETKTRHARRFLEEGNKVKVTLMFRGRQIAHPELGQAGRGSRGSGAGRSGQGRELADDGRKVDDDDPRAEVGRVVVLTRHPRAPRWFTAAVSEYMPKMKTHSGAKKRFSVTGSGKIRRLKAYKSHILTKKIPKRKRDSASSDHRDDERRSEAHQASHSGLRKPIPCHA